MFFKKVGFLFLSLFLFQCSALVLRTVSVSLVEEKIAGKLFSHRIDVVDGVKKEEWTINGKRVDQAVYEREILAAELEESKAKREEDYAQRVKMVEFQDQARSAALKKLLHTAMQDVEKLLAKFKKYEIMPYLAYKPETIPNEVEFTNISSYGVTPARNLLFSTFDPELARDSLEKLEEYSVKLATLFEDSVNRAINQCDDPKKLKKWLEMLS